MTPPSTFPWPGSLTASISDQIRSHRKRLHITADEMARRVTEFGVPYSRAQVTNLERANQRRATFTIGELLAFAAVLGVPPISLLIPTEGAIEIAPGQQVDPLTAYRWVVGEATLSGTVLASEFTEMIEAWRRLADAERRGRETGDAVFEELAAAIRREIAARGWSQAA